MASPEDSRQTKRAFHALTTPTGAYLPEDLIIDILPRLPVKSLLRFKAVSKRWYSIISSPSCIQLHLNLAIKNPQNDDSFIIHSVKRYDNLISLLRLNSPQHGFDLELPYCRANFPPLPLLPELFLVGSCDGIVCATINGFREDPFTYLWNPATKHSMLLPPNIIQCVGSNSVKVSLGFGFDSIANDYKVVRVLKLKRHCIGYRSEVYSANKNSWREIKGALDFPYYSFPCYSMCDVCVKGVLYWISLDGLLTFDLNSEVFTTRYLPDNVHATTCLQYDSRVTEYNDSVALIIHSKGDDSNNIISLWTIDDVYLRSNSDIEQGSWTRKFTFEVAPTTEWVYGYLKTGDFLVKADETVWFLYNPENKETKYVPLPGNTRGIFRYIGSLVSVTGSKEVEWKAKKDDNR